MRNFTGPVEICGARLAHELLDTTLPPNIPAEIDATYRAHASPPKRRRHHRLPRNHAHHTVKRGHKQYATSASEELAL